MKKMEGIIWIDQFINIQFLADDDFKSMKI